MPGVRCLFRSWGMVMLFALSKLRFGVSTDELKAALEAQARAPVGAPRGPVVVPSPQPRPAQLRPEP